MQATGVSQQHRQQGEDAQVHGLVDGDHPHSTVANPGLAVARSNARTGQRQSTKAWLPPDITQAKAVAGDKYVALAGSQATQQCLRAGLLDEIQVALVPLLLGGDVRLFATSADRSAWKSSACSMLQA